MYETLDQAVTVTAEEIADSIAIYNFDYDTKEQREYDLLAEKRKKEWVSSFNNYNIPLSSLTEVIHPTGEKVTAGCCAFVSEFTDKTFSIVINAKYSDELTAKLKEYFNMLADFGFANIYLDENLLSKEKYTVIVDHTVLYINPEGKEILISSSQRWVRLLCLQLVRLLFNDSYSHFGFKLLENYNKYKDSYSNAEIFLFSSLQYFSTFNLYTGVNNTYFPYYINYSGCKMVYPLHNGWDKQFTPETIWENQSKYLSINNYTANYFPSKHQSMRYDNYSVFKMSSLLTQYADYFNDIDKTLYAVKAVNDAINYSCMINGIKIIKDRKQLIEFLERVTIHTPEKIIKDPSKSVGLLGYV